MSSFYLKTTTASEPKPNASVESVDTPDFGSFGAVLDANFVAPAGARPTLRSVIYFTGVGGNHYSEKFPWVSFPLAAGSTGSGSFSAKVNAYLSAVPNFAVVKLKAALFKWNAADSNGGQIGATQTTVALGSTSASYTLTFGTDNISYSDGDRFYVEFWFHALDTENGEGAGITCNLAYNTAAIDAKIVAPGTQTEYIAASLRDPILQFGVIPFARP